MNKKGLAIPVMYIALGAVIATVVIYGIMRWRLNDPVKITPYAGTGCWALVFAGRNFDPPMAKLNGPTFIERFANDPVVTPELKPVGGEIFLRSIQSVIIGPQARLTGFSQPKFDNPSLTLEAGRLVPDLIDLGFHERVMSLKLECP
jgi:hypothetical protein